MSYLNQITINDEGWGERDYVEWQDDCWRHFYTTSVCSPHTETALTDEDRLMIIAEFGLSEFWDKPLEIVDTMSPETLNSQRATGQVDFAVQY